MVVPLLIIIPSISAICYTTYKATQKKKWESKPNNVSTIYTPYAKCSINSQYIKK